MNRYANIIAIIAIKQPHPVFFISSLLANYRQKLRIIKDKVAFIGSAQAF